MKIEFQLKSYKNVDPFGSTSCDKSLNYYALSDAYISLNLRRTQIT